MNYDLSLAKQVPVTEKVLLGIEVNAFNLFNREQFGPPTSSLSSGFFGQISSTLSATNPRQFQFGPRVSY